MGMKRGKKKTVRLRPIAYAPAKSNDCFGILIIITIIAIILGLGGFIAYKCCYAERPYTDGDFRCAPTRQDTFIPDYEEEHKPDKVTGWARFKKLATKGVKWATAPLWAVPNAFCRNQEFRTTAYITWAMAWLVGSTDSFFMVGLW